MKNGIYTTPFDPPSGDPSPDRSPPLGVNNAYLCGHLLISEFGKIIQAGAVHFRLMRENMLNLKSMLMEQLGKYQIFN